MGFRFRRSIRILPRIRINIGKRGVSTSIGVRGVHVTLGHGQVRETVRLPGSGLSYTHVEGTHRDAPSEPAADIAKGKAWRGWLWIVLLVAIVAAFLLASCSQSSVPPTKIAAPIVRNMRSETYDFQEKCGRDARDWYKDFFEDDHSAPDVTSNFTNHYNTAKNRCFALVSIDIITRDKKTGKINQSRSSIPTDVLENREIGNYFQSVDTGHFLVCILDDKTCASTGEWDALVKPYMGQ